MAELDFNEEVENPPILNEDIEMFLLKQEHARNPLKRLKEIQFLIMRAYENGQKVELGLIAELLNIIK